MPIPKDTPAGTEVWSHDLVRPWKSKTSIVSSEWVCFVDDERIWVVEQAKVFMTRQEVHRQLSAAAFADAIKAQKAAQEHFAESQKEA